MYILGDNPLPNPNDKLPNYATHRYIFKIPLMLLLVASRFIRVNDSNLNHDDTWPCA